MSARFSTSPELHLEIAESRVHARLLLGASLAVLCALVALVLRGHVLLACLLLPWALFLLLRARRDSLAGAVLAWRQGRWCLYRGRAAVALEMLPASVSLPWLIYLVWRESAGGVRRRAWLFSDSASRDGLRRLRVRLRLQH